MMNQAMFNCKEKYTFIFILSYFFILAITAKALYHKETLCKKDEVQRFLSSLVIKKPEVGHLVNCFHMAKPTNSTTNTKGCVAKPVQTDGAKTGNQPKKVITFSTIDNFGYQNWRDFSDSRLIDPSKQYPIIEIVIALNFFPGGKYFPNMLFMSNTFYKMIFLTLSLM